MNNKTSWDTEPLTAHYNSTEMEDGLQALKALGTHTHTDIRICTHTDNTESTIQYSREMGSVSLFSTVCARHQRHFNMFSMFQFNCDNSTTLSHRDSENKGLVGHKAALKQDFMQ